MELKETKLKNRIVMLEKFIRDAFNGGHLKYPGKDDPNYELIEEILNKEGEDK